MAEGWSSGAESLIYGQLKSNLLFIALAKIPECKGNIPPSSLYGSGVDQGTEEER